MKEYFNFGYKVIPIDGIRCVEVNKIPERACNNKGVYQIFVKYESYPEESIELDFVSAEVAEEMIRDLFKKAFNFAWSAQYSSRNIIV